RARPPRRGRGAPRPRSGVRSPSARPNGRVWRRARRRARLRVRGRHDSARAGRRARRGRLQSSSPRRRWRRRSGAAADSCRKVIVHRCVRSWTDSPAARSTAYFHRERGSGMARLTGTRRKGSGTRLRLAVVALVVVAAGGTLSAAGAAPILPAEPVDEPLRILVTNDDGVAAPGINVLVNALQALPNVEVTVIAP